MNLPHRCAFFVLLVAGCCSLTSTAWATEPPAALALPIDAGPGQCAGPAEAKTTAAVPMAATAFCQASCSPYSSVSCSGSSCSAVDRNCSVGQRGYVQCDGNYTYCPACFVAQCLNGAEEWVNWGCCCGAPVAKQNHRLRVCVNGSWQYTNSYSCYSSCSNPNGCELEP